MSLAYTDFISLDGPARFTAPGCQALLHGDAFFNHFYAR
jgi:hypothetical protein